MVGFASLLAQIKRGKSGSPAPSENAAQPSSSLNKRPIASHHSSNQASKPSSSSSSSSLHVQPTYDPAVARLKAARRAEKEALLKSKPTAPKQSSKSSSSTNTSSSAKTHSKPVGLSKQEQLRNQILLDKQQQQPRPLKKLSYKELMQQAAKVDGSKMAITIKSKTTSPEPPLIKLRAQSDSKSLQRQRIPDLKMSSEKKLPSSKRAAPPLMNSGAIAKRRKIPAGERVYQDDNEDLSDFVVSEDEALDYHAEILNIFGRGGRKYDYDDFDSDDDMEATGADILYEESKSSRIARLEEEKEAELERRKKMEKLKRLKKS